MSRAPLAACALTTILVLLTLAHFALSDPKPLTLTVRPTAAMAPATLELHLRVHAVPADAWITVQMDDGSFRRESTWQPDPDRTLYTWSWRDVPAGNFEVTAAIGSGSTPRAVDRVAVQIGE